MQHKMMIAAALALAATGLSAPAAAEKPIELSPTELAAQQSRTYPVAANGAFAAAIATLQTLGYVDIEASKDAGTISAETETKGKIFYNILWGFGKKKLTQKASLLVEEHGPTQSLVRLNLHVTETKARGIFGTSFSDGKLVRFGEPYSSFFDALDAEVARRAALSAPPVASVAASPPLQTPAPPPAEAEPVSVSNPQ